MMYLGIFETSFIINLCILTATTYTVRHAQKPENQAAVTYMSVGTASATFVGVLVHHTYQQVWPKLQQRIHLLRHCRGQQSEGFEEAGVDTQAQTPTMTIVECPSSRSPEPEAQLFISSASFTELRKPFLSKQYISDL